MFAFLNHFLKTRSTFSLIGIAVIQLALLGLVDAYTDYQLSLSLFYIVPIAMVSWYLPGKTGILTAVVSALIWLLADVISRHTYPHSLYYFWNAVIRFGIFFIIASLLNRIKLLLENERKYARIDTLTQVYNRRYFFELAGLEIERARRYNQPLTLAYIDLDNFKNVNDTQGHHAGDQALQMIGATLLKNHRKTDMIGRLGGDEFAILLPNVETTLAHLLVEKTQEKLTNAMRENGWPVTFSIGVVTCNQPIDTIQQLVNLADGLMYEVKRNHKNAIAYHIHGTPPQTG